MDGYHFCKRPIGVSLACDKLIDLYVENVSDYVGYFKRFVESIIVIDSPPSLPP